jgi:hypothetical protein
MAEAEDYLVRAKECREMAKRSMPDQKKALEEMAKAFELLAARQTQMTCSPICPRS